MTDTVDATMVTCGCCGEPRLATAVARLNCLPDVAICGGCADGLASKLHARPAVTAIFPVRDMDEAREFWTRAGVDVELYEAATRSCSSAAPKWRTCASIQGWILSATLLRATSMRQIRLAGINGGQQPASR